MRARFVIAPPGGGRKTEISTARGGGWLIREFEYSDDGKRTKTGEQINATDEQAIEALQQDPDFFTQLRKLCESEAMFV